MDSFEWFAEGWPTAEPERAHPPTASSPLGDLDNSRSLQDILNGIQSEPCKFPDTDQRSTSATPAKQASPPASTPAAGKKQSSFRWTPQEVKDLERLVGDRDGSRLALSDWEGIALAMGSGRTASAVKTKWRDLLKPPQGGSKLKGKTRAASVKQESGTSIEQYPVDSPRLIAEAWHVSQRMLPRSCHRLKRQPQARRMRVRSLYSLDRELSG